jgi:hypothetical protein
MTALLLGIKTYLAAKGEAVLLGALVPVAVAFLGKWIPKFIGNYTAKFLDTRLGEIDKINDPVRRELYEGLALQVVKIVEYEIPDAGKGAERYKLAAAKICGFLPFLKGHDDVIKDFIEKAVNAMDEEFKKHRDHTL